MLVSDGEIANTRDAVVAIRALAEAGYPVAVTVAERSWKSAVSRYVGERVLMPSIATTEFGEELDHVLGSGRFGCVIAASERVSMVVHRDQTELMNKVGLEARAKAAGLDTLPTTPFSSLEALLSSATPLDFPVVIKPQIRSFQAVKVSSDVELSKVTQGDVPLMVQPFVSGAIEVISGVMWDEDVHSAVQERWHRIWPRDCGLAATATSVEINEDLVAGLAEVMGSHQGLFSAQFLDGKLIDLNLRAHSSLPLAVAAGVNSPAILAGLTAGDAVPGIRGRPGQRYRWISGDVKGAVADYRSGSSSLMSSVSMLTPRRGTVHSMFSIRDPLPFLLRLSSYV